jgi:pSer/pThr/pTyr-binding forkhead associated (FHA) protein
MVQPRGRRAAEGEPPEQAHPGATMIYKPQPQDADSAPPAEEEQEQGTFALSWNGERREVDKRRLVLGRSRECDIQLGDPNVSRRHAELRQEGSSYWIVDLDSTNGLEVNGKRVKRAKLDDGDVFTIGSTEVRFSREAE